MSDIQQTEADREEARKAIAAHDNIPSQYLQVDDFTVERVAEVIARIRADAVKAERERVELIITEEILEYDCDLTDLVNTVVSRILSDDQEARRG